MHVYFSKANSVAVLKEKQDIFDFPWKIEDGCLYIACFICHFKWKAKIHDGSTNHHFVVITYFAW